MEVKKIDLQTHALDSLKESNPSNVPSQSSLTRSNLTRSKWLFFGFALVLGLPTGFFSAKVKLKSQLPITSSKTDFATIQRPTQKNQVKVGQVFGSSDEKTFRDHAIGILKKGGIDGEGSHHLVRPGGPSKNVYLTSSVIDLDLFEGDKVEVWGETFGAKKAGWLMDVGRIKVLELNAVESQE